jgi:excisionase family DNA binding protein
MTVIAESLLLRVNEVASLLGISRSSVYRLIEQKHLQAVQVNQRSVRIPRWEVERYVEFLRQVDSEIEMYDQMKKFKSSDEWASFIKAQKEKSE